MAFNAKNKDKITAVKGLDSSSVYTEQDQKKRLEAAAEAGKKARQAAVEKLKKQNRESREANDKARKQAVAQSNANRAKTASIEERVDQKRQITDAMTKTREWGAGKGDKWQSRGDFRTAYNAYENAVNWAEQAEAAGDAATAKYMREAASYLAKWGNAAGSELAKITNQYGSFDNAVDYRSGDKSGYREYLNRDKTWDEINRHITGLKRTIDTTSDLKRRAEYMDELSWYEDYARNNYTEAAQGELEQLQRRQNTLQSALAQADINNSPLTGTPVGERQRAETLRRFDEDIAAAKAGNMDTWYISALEKAREQFLADEAPVSYEQNWQDIDRYDELSRQMEGVNTQIADAKDALEKAKNSEYERENRIKYAALEQEMNAADWYFDQYDYDDFLQQVKREKNAARDAMPNIDILDLRNLYTKEEAGIYSYLMAKGREDEATAYANYMQPIVAARRNQQIEQFYSGEDFNIAERTLLSAVTNPGKIVNTIDINLQKLSNVLSDDYVPIDYETTANFGVASNVNRELATQELNALGTLNDLIGRDIPYVGSYTLGDLYGTGMDLLNSVYNAALFGTSGAGAALAAEKFSDEYRAAKGREGSDNEAFNYAWGSSIAEGVGEQIVLNRYLGFLTKLGKRPGKMSAIIAGVVNAAEGGVQEAVTTVMENVVDKWTMGENSEYSRSVKRYEAMGYERGTAEQMAIDDMNREILKSGIMGAIGQGAPVAIGGAAYGIRDAIKDAGATRALGKDIIGQGNAAGMAQLIGEVSGKQTKARTSAGAVGRQYTKFAQNAQKYVEAADESVRGVIKEKADRVMMAPVMALDGTSQATKEKASKRMAAMRKSDEGASVGGENVTVQGFVKTAGKDGDARLNIKKADGTLAEANMEDVTFDTRTAEVYSYAADMATPELANMFRMSIQPDQMAGIERVANGYSQAYDMAKAGFKEASVRASSLTDALTDEQVSAAYKLGADARSAGQMQAITAARQRAEANMGKAWKGGKATFDSSVVVDALDDEQKNQIDMASAVTGAMGVNVVFFESKADETGRYTRENGSYNRKTNTIYIDVNAGRNYKGDSMTKTALLRTLSHEVTHAIQRNSPEIYAELRDMVVDILGDAKGATIEDLIDRKLAQDGSLTTRDAAIDELVADACEKMLEDSDAAQRLAEAHPEAAKTIFQKVGELLTKLKEAIKAAFKGRQLSTEAQLVMKDVERYQKMVDLWTKGVMQTAEVSGRELGETTDSETENAAISEETAAEGEDITSGADVYTFFNPKDIKSADPFTFDEDGNLIPLSERFSDDEDIRYQARSFSAQIDDLFNGTFPVDDHLYVMDTPDILVKIGMKRLPVLLTQYHAKTITKIKGPLKKAHYHGLTKTGIKALPGYISEPVMIIQSPGYSDRVVVLTDMLNRDGENVIAPIKIDGRGNWQNVEIDANILTTAYGKADLKRMVVSSIQEDRVLYVDKKRSDALSQTLGVQFPNNLRSGGFIHSIRRNQDVVNPDIQKQTRNPDQISVRELLLNSQESNDSEESAWLAGYKADLGKLMEKQAELDVQREELERLNRNARQSRQDAKQRSIEYGARSGLGKTELALLSRYENTIDTLEQMPKLNEAQQSTLDKARANFDYLKAKAAEGLKDGEFEEWRRQKKLSEGEIEQLLSDGEREDLLKVRNRVSVLSGQLARMDEGLLKQEASKPIMNIVEREREKAKKKADKRVERLRNRYATDAIRKRLSRKAATLDERLRRPKDGAFIPDEFKQAAIELDKLIADMNIGYSGDAGKKAGRRIDRIQRELAAMKAQGTNIAQAVDEDLVEELAETEILSKDKLISEMTMDDLQLIEKTIDHMLYLSNNAYNVLIDGKNERVEEAAAVQAEEMEGKRAKKREGLLALIKQMARDESTPIYFFRRLGGKFQELAQGLFDGESDYGILANEAGELIEDIKKRHNYTRWYRDGILEIVPEFGGRLKLNREEALMLYATHKREVTNTRQDARHLEQGGVVEKHTDPRIKGAVLSEKGVRLTEADMQQISNWLTAEQKAYADEVVAYLSGELAEKLNEASRRMHGYSKFTERYYFPYRVSKASLPQNIAEAEAKLIASVGMSKSTVANASKPVMLGEFTDMVTEHITTALLYTTIAPAQQDFMRLLNYRFEEGAHAGNTMTELVTDAYGQDVMKYMLTFMADIWGSTAKKGSLEALADRMTSRFKKNAVAMSASVWLQQYTSLYRAWAVMGPQYFYGKIHNPKGSWEEAKRYAGTAVLKDIGRFDTNVGRNVAEWIADKKDYRWLGRLGDLTDSAMGWIPEKMDMLAWTRIWEACKREQASKLGMDIGSEEVKRAAGRRMDEVTRLTQVYDSVFSKSAMMRSKNPISKTFTNFMAESTITVNMLMDAWMNIKKDPARFVRTNAVLLLSTVMVNLFASLAYAWRDKDEDETYLEKYAQSLVSGFVDDLNFMNYLPFLNQVASEMRGFSSERTEMATIADTLGYAKLALKMDSDDTLWQRLGNAGRALGSATGYPIKNILREYEGIKRTIQNAGNVELREGALLNAVKYGAAEGSLIATMLGIEDSKNYNADQMFEAILDGDMARAEELREHLIVFNGVADDDAVDSLLRNRIKEGFIAGEIDEAEALEMLTEHGGKRRNEAEDLISEWSYTRDNDGRKYDDMKDAFLAGEISAEEAIDARVKYGGAEEENSEKTVQTWQYQKDTGYVYDDMRDDVLDGEISAADAIAYRVKYGGVKQETAEATVGKWEYERQHGYAYEDLREEHAAGNITSAEAMRAMTEYGGKEVDDAYWEVAEWDYVNDGGEWDGKATMLNDAFAGGNAAEVRSSMAQLLEHSNWKKPGNELASYVTNYYKPLFEAATADRKRQLQPVILDYIQMAYEAAGEEYFGDDYTLRYRNWLKIK